MEGGRVLILLFLTGSCLLRDVSAYSTYQPRIPNAGDRSRSIASKVPSPFGVDGVYCDSVGHAEMCTGPPSGNGNPFGKAFHGGSKTWDATICNADSDGDGVSNGAELGDPNCIWSQGDTTSRVTGLSHPGFSCSTSSDPFCLVAPVSTGAPSSNNNDDSGDGESMKVPSWQAAVGAAVAIFAIKYILTIFAQIQADRAAAERGGPMRKGMSRKEMIEMDPEI